ncbi:MAG: DUF1801 domain-containing protein [Emcibacteraceae bacterium]|nr:DUF1801 domain-containing protein [Emcibacteraceae bacterium]
MVTAIQQKLKNNLLTEAYGNISYVVYEKLLCIRTLIYEQAETLSNVGNIREELKWGQPSYSSDNKSGTPIRLGVEKKNPNHYGLFVNCSTTLIEDIKHIYGDVFKYDGNRAVLFTEKDDLPIKELRHIIDMALTYHLKH